MLFVSDSITNDTLAKSIDILPPQEYAYTFKAAGYSTQVRLQEVSTSTNDILLCYFTLEEVQETNWTAFAFNGKEKDDETYGNGNEYDFGARIYDTRIGRWLSIDVLASKYPQFSPYIGFGNNPIIYLDPNGKDLVYFDDKGHEIGRLKSSIRFETYVSVAENTKGAMQAEVTPLLGTFVQVTMPNIIQTKGGSPTTSPKYQELDYQIAASTFIFNQNKNTTQFYTDGSKKIPTAENANIPTLDPTLVKAVIMQESGMGTGRKDDVMTSNAKGDWGAWKKKYGVQQNVTTDPELSINAGIKEMTTKGFKADGSSYKWEASTSWLDAAGKYNGGGTPGYQESVEKMCKESQTPIKSNYVEKK